MPAFKLTIAYDGTGLVGWQRQAQGVSVQGLLEDAVRELTGRPAPVTGAGRTDAGVHAWGQVASLAPARDIEAGAIRRALNGLLPPVVRVRAAEDVPASFNARFDARSKLYRYRIWNAAIQSPFERAYSWHRSAPALNLEAMKSAAARLEGRHDFAAFQAAGSATTTTVRRVLSCTVERRGPLVTCEVRGEGFLRHMVRIIVGSLVEVGRGRRSAGWLDEVLASRRRDQAGPTAPACGLFLVSVAYGPPAESELAAER